MKKFLKAILLSSMLLVMSAVSAMAADGTIAISFKDSEGAAVSSLKVGESATMEMTLTLAGSPKIGTAEIFYELENLTLTSEDANYTGTTFQLMNFSAADIRSQTWTATVTASAAGTGKFTVTADSYAADTDGNEMYEFDVTGNTLTIVAAAKEDINVTAPTVSFTEKFEKDSVEYYHGAALLEFSVAENNNAVKYVTVTANNGTNTNTKKIELPTTITAVGTAKIGLNILNVPTTVTSITLSNIVTSAE